MHTNPDLDLAAALAEFARGAPKVRLEIDIAAPQNLAQGLLSGRYHVILCPAQRYPGHVQATDLFVEEQLLYCGAGHPLFDVPDEAISKEMLAAYPFAGRTYMAEEPICGVNFNWAAVTAHMEGTAFAPAAEDISRSYPPTSRSNGWLLARCELLLPIGSPSSTASRSSILAKNESR